MQASATLVFGRAIARPSIEARVASRQGASVCVRLAGQLLGPPLKRRARRQRPLATVAFGRAIARPSIEAIDPRTIEPSMEKFGRAIARPSIEAASHVACLTNRGRLAGQLLGPPLKRADRPGDQHRLRRFGRAIARPSIEATATSKSSAPASPTFGRAIARPSIEAAAPTATARRGRCVWPGNCSALH